MRLHSVISFPILLATTWFYAAASAGSYIGSSSTFSINQKTEVPGQTLAPGDYTIRVLDQLNDRMIVRIDSPLGKNHTVFLAVPNAKIGASAGVVEWSSTSKGTGAIRGFSFAPGKSIEFVYPKSEAVALAKVNSARVIAVDPESQGMPNLQHLSKDDMQIVSLWMLSMTTAGADQKTPAVVAEKYAGESIPVERASTRPNAAPAQPQTQVARLETPQTEVGVAAPGAPSRTARLPISRLPKTASSLPSILSLSILALVAFAVLRWRRRGLA